MKYRTSIIALALLGLVTWPCNEAIAGGEKASNSQVKAPEAYSLYLKSGHRSPKWDELIEPGFQSFDGGNYATAYVFLKRAYDRGCRDGLLLFRLGLYKESQGQYKEAASFLAEGAEKLPKQYPGHPLAKSIHDHAGRVLYQADDYARALPELLKAIDVTPDNFMALFMAGQILRIKKEYTQAKQLLEKALAAKLPQDITTNPRPRVLAELMIVAYELKDLDAALSYANQILETSPTDTLAQSYKEKIQRERLRLKEREAIDRLVK